MLRFLGIRCSRGTQLTVNIVLLSLVWLYAKGLELGDSYTFMMQAFPYWCLVTLGCYAMGSIGYKLWVLEDCKDDEASLQREMKEAKAELGKKGFRFDAGKGIKVA